MVAHKKKKKNNTNTINNTAVLPYDFILITGASIERVLTILTRRIIGFARLFVCLFACSYIQKGTNKPTLMWKFCRAGSHQLAKI